MALASRALATIAASIGIPQSEVLSSLLEIAILHSACVHPGILLREGVVARADQILLWRPHQQKSD